MGDSLTLVLDGTVTLDDFARAVTEFRGLVAALSEEVAPDSEIQWVITGLEYSSALATAQGRGKRESVGGVVGAYERVGEALEQSRPVPFSDRAQRHARALSLLVSDRIPFVKFETEDVDSIVRRPAPKLVAVGATPQPLVKKFPSALGAVEGMVETVSSRGGLRFTLYDTLHDKAVSCYLKPGYEEIMRNLWGKRAIVSGNINRDTETGRPLTVRQVTAATLIPERGPEDWRGARGALAGRMMLAPETIIRAARDR